MEKPATEVTGHDQLQFYTPIHKQKNKETELRMSPSGSSVY